MFLLRFFEKPYVFATLFLKKPIEFLLRFFKKSVMLFLKKRVDARRSLPHSKTSV